MELAYELKIFKTFNVRQLGNYEPTVRYLLKVCESYPRFVTTVCVEIARKFDALSKKKENW